MNLMYFSCFLHYLVIPYKDLFDNVQYYIMSRKSQEEEFLIVSPTLVYFGCTYIFCEWVGWSINLSLQPNRLTDEKATAAFNDIDNVFNGMFTEYFLRVRFKHHKIISGYAALRYNIM